MSIIKLTTCNNVIEANMIKNLLENEDIQCFLTNENFSTLLPINNSLLGSGIRIMINEEDFEKAKQVIDSVNNTPTENHSS